MDKERYLASVKKGKQRNGKSLLISFLEGKRLSPQQAIRAWCYDCMGFYDDGARDCESDTCPLHPFMPYNPNRQKLTNKGSAEGLKKWREANAANGDNPAEEPEDELEDADEEEAEEIGA